MEEKGGISISPLDLGGKIQTGDDLKSASRSLSQTGQW